MTANQQHLWRLEAGCAATYLMHGDGVVRQKDGICRLRSHLQTKHKRQFEILAADNICLPPLTQSVRAGVPGWVLEQGEGARNRGQQLMLHGEPGAPSNQSDTCAALRSGPAPGRQKLTDRPH